jgi:hypothetical protein
VKFEVGDLIKWTHTDNHGKLVWTTEHLGVVIRTEHSSIKVRWENGKESWMNAAWLERVE